MITFRLTAQIPQNRQIVVTLPPEVPAGNAELVVTITPQATGEPKRPGTSLADWAEANAEDWGDRITSEDVESFTGRRF